LYEIVDLYINTHVPMGDAAVDLLGFKQKWGFTLPMPSPLNAW
jgi:hypothetical protein